MALSYDGLVLQEDGDADSGLHHRQLPVPVGVRAVDDLGQADGAEHGGAAAGVRPGAVVGVLDDLGGPRPGGAGPAGLQGRIAVGVVPDHGGPGVHQLDGLAGVPFVARDVPGEGVGVRGDRVLALVGAAEVGVVVRTAFDDRPWPGRAVQVGVLARHHPVEGTLPGLGAGVGLGPGEVQLPLRDGDSGVGEGGGGAGGGVGGPGEDTADEGGEAARRAVLRIRGGLPFLYMNVKRLYEQTRWTVTVGTDQCTVKVPRTRKGRTSAGVRPWCLYEVSGPR
ncbi:hypothetical protein SUDANB1_02078 [Streptomyces sp. enrichment culture]